MQFLRRKLQEYEQIRQQINELGRDIQNDDLPLAEVSNLTELIG